VYVADPLPAELLIATIIDKLDKVIIVKIKGKLISFLHPHFRDAVLNIIPPFLMTPK